MVDKVLDEKKKVEGELKTLAANYSELLSEKLMREAEIIGDNKIIIYLGDKVVGQFLGRYIDLDTYLLITGNDENYSLMSNKVNCKEFIKHLSLLKVESKVEEVKLRVISKEKFQKMNF